LWDAFISGVVALANDGVDFAGGKLLGREPIPQRSVKHRVFAGGRSGAPSLISAVEAIHLRESKIGKGLRIFAAGVAVIAVDQDRPRLGGGADDGADVA
jgi:hypothetical protein